LFSVVIDKIGSQ